jgi:hypothetical protein
MPTVTATVLAAHLKVDTRAKLKLLGRNGQDISLPITDASSPYSGLESDWEEVPRPGRQPLNLKAGYKLAQVQLTITLMPPDGGVLDPTNTVQQLVTELTRMANNDSADQPIAFVWGIYDSSLFLSSSGHWHIESMTITPIARQPFTNNISQATVSITLKEASDV